MHSEQIRIRGLVQGVGFRPTVWQLAQQFGINGEVRNDGSGVLIIAQSKPEQIDLLLQQLQSNPPALARIDSIQRETLDEIIHFQEFSILHSLQSEVHTGIVADAATCSECLQDISDPSNRRYQYAFTNCTHCGPRLSIIRDIPYDRAYTSMAAFELCPACQAEYENPADRRFHAQPNACPDCGPQLWIVDTEGQTIPSERPLDSIAELIRQGHIVALKGIGGFQLACDAGNHSAVETLRARKRRPHKALALMANSVSQIRQYCLVNNEQHKLLQSNAAPIVLLQLKQHAQPLSPAIAPAQHTLGFMLPNSPLHHLLCQQLERPIVLTSGNRSEEPQCIDNQQAQQRLKHIADYFLMHDRDIINRIDDSVVRVIHHQPHFLRRARGYAPRPIPLPDGFINPPNILACGSEMKNTFCLIRDGQATLSQHIGNLENAHTYDDYLHNLELYQRLFRFPLQHIVVDRHPEYLSSKHGRQLARDNDIRIDEVQHHHAHIAACLADNGWARHRGKVIGVVMDGLGFGDDGSIWGGEFLLADYLDYQRIGRLKPAPMPGGVQSILQPWRNTYAQLQQLDDWPALQQRYADLALMQTLSAQPLNTLEQMIRRAINTPLTSSCGRLFDAVAAALGICADHISYEGQAAIELESCITAPALQQASPYLFTLEQHELLEINPETMWRALLQDLQQGTSAAVISARFHRGLAQAIADSVSHISHQSGIRTVALSGGVFQNQTLFRLCLELLRQQPLKILVHQQLPANDGGISFGQALIAAARANLRETTTCV
ncbi:MAG: carbamoyltransferase HypF [Gammaproteobacteria bacterium]|nr:carbamoyltransferase HypF [Gammaproteobacteria bacterium]MBL6998858.1 carbamoyltransferase HypF [Gammaproteobacteria bacterium]